MPLLVLSEPVSAVPLTDLNGWNMTGKFPVKEGQMRYRESNFEPDPYPTLVIVGRFNDDECGFGYFITDDKLPPGTARPPTTTSGGTFWFSTSPDDVVEDSCDAVFLIWSRPRYGVGNQYPGGYGVEITTWWATSPRCDVQVTGYTVPTDCTQVFASNRVPDSFIVSIASEGGSLDHTDSVLGVSPTAWPESICFFYGGYDTTLKVSLDLNFSSHYVAGLSEKPGLWICKDYLCDPATAKHFDGPRVKINEDHNSLWYYRLNLRGATDFHLFQLYFHNPGSPTGVAAAPTVWQRHVTLARDASGAPYLTDDQPDYPNHGYCSWRDDDRTVITRPSGFGPMLTVDWVPPPTGTPARSGSPSASKSPPPPESLTETPSPSKSPPQSQSPSETHQVMDRSPTATAAETVSALSATDEEVSDATISPELPLVPPTDEPDNTPVIAFAVGATGVVAVIGLTAYLIHRATSLGLP